ncbi:MAG: rare lipoprotein A [Hyphomonadaceae bacterium]|nr:MAG: rare lipoprotein A [Hyphomonadaceae bacterium]KAF0185358.1 MAG: rare lipoprotein A [Hyphomonadaceae bacterium]
MVTKKRASLASIGLCFTFAFALPNGAKAENIGEAAAQPANRPNPTPLRTISTEAAALGAPRTTPPRTANATLVRPRYGRLITTPIAAPSVAPPRQVAHEDDAPPHATTRAQYVAAEVEMKNLGIGENQEADISLVSDVRPEDIASWQKIGGPYQVNGIWYIPAHEPDYDETGTASWYGNSFNGRPTANGEVFDENIVTVAHPTLPIPSLVEITNLENGRSIVARVNDRGPFAGNRLVDVSARGAQLLGFKEQGSAQVRVRYIGQAPRATTIATTANQQTATLQIDNVTTRSSQPRVTQTRVATATPTNAAPARTSSANDNSSNRFVQIGVFSNRTNAERALRDAEPLGNTRIIPVQSNGANMFKVLVGPFEDAQSATIKAEEANGLGVNGAHVIMANIS